MFERNRIDNLPEPTAVPVELALADGVTAKGKVLVPMGKTLADILNGPLAFIEFEPYGGERGFIAKAQIASVKPIGIPRAPSLAAGLKDGDAFNPYAVLGMANGAAWEDVRGAYLRLAKVYHPDRYAHTELPAEIGEYLAVMARRVNAAYAALEPVQQSNKAAAARPAPVYATAARA